MGHKRGASNAIHHPRQGLVRLLEFSKSKQDAIGSLGEFRRSLDQRLDGRSLGRCSFGQRHASLCEKGAGEVERIRGLGHGTQGWK